MLSVVLELVREGQVVASGTIRGRRATLDVVVRRAREGEDGHSIAESSGGLLRRTRDMGRFVVEGDEGKTVGEKLSKLAIWAYFQETLAIFAVKSDPAHRSRLALVS